MPEEHFYVTANGLSCDICGLSRFNIIHPTGELDLPVERTFCRLEAAIAQQIHDALKAEQLLPFDHFGQPCTQEYFTSAIMPMFRKYLTHLLEQLGTTCDGPLNGYRQVQATWTGPKYGFAKHRFQSDERGLLCQECGMVNENALHEVRLIV